MNNIQLSRNNSVRPLRLSHTWMVFFKETKINKGELQGVHGFSQNVQICRELRWSSISDSQICLFFYLLFCIGVYPITEKAMAPHSSTLAWQIPWMGEPGRLRSMGSLVSDTNERLHFHFSLSCVGEGNGNPLQCSCLEDPRDGGAWWAAVYGVAQSRT